ncbi:S9 family peptidase [Shewanella cyperi]|uniref:S9 family peptidase n=1 Tax=Shewanella cyperi TaxID=2814292 RepID=A0A974XPH3_9GAMM|nr:S9 family peptidase [Shewanella cyperi]
MILKTLPLVRALALCLGTGFWGQSLATTQTLSLQDIMAFETAKTPVLADNGNSFAVELEPDRGDSRTLVQTLDKNASYSIAGASAPILSADGRFAAMKLAPSLLAMESSDAKAKKALKAGMVLLDLTTGAEQRFERVKSFAFSEQGDLLAIWFEVEEEKKAEDKKVEEPKQEPQSPTEPEKSKAANSNKTSKPNKADAGSELTLIALGSGKQLSFSDVTGYSFARETMAVALVRNQSGDTPLHQLLLLSGNTLSSRTLLDSKDQHLGALALSPDGKAVALTLGDAAVDTDEREYQLLLIDDSGKRKLAARDKDWTLNRYGSVQFSRDGKRVFVGRVPEVSKPISRKQFKTEADLRDEAILQDNRGLKVWHSKDPLIKPNEIKEYSKEVERTYLAVWHLGKDAGNKLVQLADSQVPDVTVTEQRRFLLGSSNKPYQLMSTWAGAFRDYYLVDLDTGRKQLLVAQLESDNEPTLSGDGRFLAYFQQGQVYLYDIAAGRRFNLSGKLKVSFADEDHDYPSSAPGYGFGPWLEDGAGILVYDKYDIWQFDSRSHEGFMLTGGEGRRLQLQLRVAGLVEDPLQPSTIKPGETLLLHGYGWASKADSFWQARVGSVGIKPLLQEEQKLTVLARAKHSEQILFSKERYDRYPDIHSAKLAQVAQAVQQTDLDAQRRQFGWGQSELVHWTNTDGKLLDGVLIKPVGYQEGKRYPVLVYFYRFMSDRLHAFPQMQVNHRPNFAWYAANGYAIFLPDIRFEIGYPGNSSVQALTSGVQKLIEMGVADPKAVGLQGHSWGGYQTAFAVTQTNLFAAAVTGAPVANMTSAYSGIRLGTGLARQFQYETGQSRIGESLMSAPQKYIENSPVFYVDRIKTPLMIMFGDRDDAVPWEQGIELYLAMRRAGKEVVFLQYEDEPHHLKKYPNKLDYSLKMMAFFDHFLKGAPAPEWLEKGEPYREFKDAE